MLLGYDETILNTVRPLEGDGSSQALGQDRRRQDLVAGAEELRDDFLGKGLGRPGKTVTRAIECIQKLFRTPLPDSPGGSESADSNAGGGCARIVVVDELMTLLRELQGNNLWDQASGTEKLLEGIHQQSSFNAKRSYHRVQMEEETSLRLARDAALSSFEAQLIHEVKKRAAGRRKHIESMIFASAKLAVASGRSRRNSFLDQSNQHEQELVQEEREATAEREDGHTPKRPCQYRTSDPAAGGDANPLGDDVATRNSILLRKSLKEAALKSDPPRRELHGSHGLMIDRGGNIVLSPPLKQQQQQQPEQEVPEHEEQVQPVYLSHDDGEASPPA